jgi:hypothetical protein
VKRPVPWKIWRVDIPSATQAGRDAGRVVRVWFSPSRLDGGCYFTQTLATERLAVTVACGIARGNGLRKRAGKHEWNETRS